MKTKITKTRSVISMLIIALTSLLGHHLKAQVCTASFNYTINANGNVSFQSTSTPSTLNHSWFFGNNQSSTATNPSVTYTANGIYTVHLATWNSPTTCSASAQQTIQITNAPTSTCNLNASFTNTVGANGNVFFTNTSTNTSTLTFYHWTINNNFFSTAQNPTTTLSNGTYTICLNVNDSLNNCFDSYCDVVTISNSTTSPCTASFNYTINANGNVSFQSTTNPSTVNLSWSFGNNQTSTLPNPSITYTANGTYVVSLFIWNAAWSCSASVQQTITITNAPTSTCNLNASFTKTVGTNGNVFFTNTSTNTSTLTFYQWNINANFFSTAQNPTTTLSNGTYTICLNVYDSLNNCFDSYCDLVTITNSTTTPCNLNANYTYTVWGNGNISYASTTTGTTSSTIYNWSFGNNQTANTPNATITYTSNGWYNVCLFVSDSTNTCSDSYCSWVYVSSASSSLCNASFTYSVGANGSVTLTSNSTGTSSNTHYVWTVNNNTSTTTTQPQISTTFTNFFTNVCLTIIDSTSNCWSTYCDSIIIPSNPCNASVSFAMVQDSTQALTWWAWANYPSNTTNAVWNWGDNTSSTGFYPSHTYSASGFYNICVTITVSCAGTASFCSNTFINKSAEAQMPMYHVNVINAQTPTGVKNYAARESMTDVSLYPNPAKDQSHLKLNMNEAGDVTLSIYEITGKLVQQGTHNLSEGVNTIDMDTNSLAKGMYLVTINSGSAKKTVRLIKE